MCQDHQFRLPSLLVGTCAILDRRTTAVCRSAPGCKHPILWLRELSCLFPRLQSREEFAVNDQLPAGLCGFHIVHLLAHNAAFYRKLAVNPVHVFPFQGKAFTDSQPKTTAQQSHRAERFLQMVNKLLELFHSEASRLMSAFTCSLMVTNSIGSASWARRCAILRIPIECSADRVVGSSRTEPISFVCRWPFSHQRKFQVLRLRSKTTLLREQPSSY